jgi:osmotically-inducible protein OsmY
LAAAVTFGLDVVSIEGIKTAHHFVEMFKAMKGIRAVLTDEQLKNEEDDAHGDGWKKTCRNAGETIMIKIQQLKENTMKARKVIYMLSLLVAAFALLVITVPVMAAETDDRIESAAKDSYVFKTYFKDDAIKIESKDGVVTLTGTVSEESHKSMAQDTVESLPGVKSVDNRLEVKGERPVEKSDAWITAKVKATLFFHRSVSAFTNVDTKDGVVTLQGEADNQAQIDLTTEYAKDVDGVKDVKNEMTVAQTTKQPAGTAVDEKASDVGEMVDDASITALVKGALLYHRSTSGLNTKVETKDGVVTLTGKAKNAAEKDLAAKYAGDVRGVKSVNNQMTTE